MKILFLDFDGVLNSDDYFEASGFTPEDIQKAADKLDPEPSQILELRKLAIDSEAVQRVNRIIEATGAQVVLSTNWARQVPVPELRELLEARGFEGVILGRTPRKLSSMRVHEIQLWLRDHPEVTHFCILEDAFPMHHLTPHTVRTQYRHGLTDEGVEKAIQLLTGGP